MSENMNAADPRVGDIQARLAKREDLNFIQRAVTEMQLMDEDIPYLLAQLRARDEALGRVVADAKSEAWYEGHESGFWNGRESAGHHEMRYVGLEHAQLNNPYRTAP